MKPIKILYFTILFSYKNIFSDNYNFSLLENYERNNLINLEENIINIKSKEDWLELSINKGTISALILKCLLKKPKLYKIYITLISNAASKKLITIKKSLFKLLGADSNPYLKSSIKTNLDIIEYYIALGHDILKYPQRDILNNSIQTLIQETDNNILIQDIQYLINNLKESYIKLKEPIEIKNYIEAIQYVSNLNLKNIKDIKISHILNINKIVLKNIDNDNAGKWRLSPCNVQGYYNNSPYNEQEFPSALEIPTIMQNFINWATNHQEKDTVKFVVDFHIKLTAIHPFVDGNGRTIRLLINLILILNGYHPILISRAHPLYSEYYNIIHKILSINCDSHELYFFIKNIISKPQYKHSLHK